MGTAKHHFHASVPIPPHLPPSSIIAALHDHATTLTLQALTVGHERLPETSPDTLKDTYWYPPDLHPVASYSVTEVVPILPGVRKQITFPSCYQNTAQGIRTRADTSGVVVRAEFRVLRGDEVGGSSSSSSSGAGGGGDGGGGAGGDAAHWVLVEDVDLSCARWMMPFVKSKMEDAHRDIVRKVVDKVDASTRGGGTVQIALPEDGADEEISGPAPLGGLMGIDTGVPPRVPDKITYG
jgi:hypothetical protein